MTWPVDSVVSALVGKVSVPSRADEIEMVLFDSRLGRGVGHDAAGRIVVVLPSQDSPPAFQTAALEFYPRRRVSVVGTATDGGPLATLACDVNVTDPIEVRIVAHVIVSLFELQSRFGQIGSAVTSLRGLFADGFSHGPTEDIVAGLAGELLLIDASGNPNRAVAAWRVEPHDNYDFSARNRRIEVKATTGPVRLHHFTSRQLPPLPGIEVHVASVRVPRVASGTSLSSLVARVKRRLSPDAGDKLSLVVFETLGMNADAVTEPEFDLASASDSIALVRGEDVPTPVQVAGVSDVRWQAFVDDSLKDNSVTIDDLLADNAQEA